MRRSRARSRRAILRRSLAGRRRAISSRRRTRSRRAVLRRTRRRLRRASKPAAVVRHAAHCHARTALALVVFALGLARHRAIAALWHWIGAVRVHDANGVRIAHATHWRTLVLASGRRAHEWIAHARSLRLVRRVWRHSGYPSAAQTASVAQTHVRGARCLHQELGASRARKTVWIVWRTEALEGGAHAIGRRARASERQGHCERER